MLIDGLRKIGYECMVREKPDGPTGSLIAFKPDKVTFISDGYLQYTDSNQFLLYAKFAANTDSPADVAQEFVFG